MISPHERNASGEVPASPRRAVLDWLLGTSITLTAILLFSPSPGPPPDPVLPAWSGEFGGGPIAGGPILKGTPIDGGKKAIPVPASAGGNANSTAPDTEIQASIAPPGGHHGATAPSGGNADILGSLHFEGDGPHVLGWEVLTCFEFSKQKLNGPGKGEIPEQIQAIAGKKFTVSGFPLPLRLRGNSNQVSELLLLRNPLQCCYGVAPRPNEWIEVTLADDAKLESCGGKVSITGVLEVGDRYRNGWIASIYRMKEADGEPMK
jgi:hypothetical protein